MSKHKKAKKRQKAEKIGFVLNPEHPVNDLTFRTQAAFNLSPGAMAIWGVLLMNVEEGLPVSSLCRYTPTALNWDLPELEAKGLARTEGDRVFIEYIDVGDQVIFPAVNPDLVKDPMEGSIRRTLLAFARGLRMREFEFSIPTPGDGYTAPASFLRAIKAEHRAIYRETKRQLMAVNNQLRWRYLKIGHDLADKFE